MVVLVNVVTTLGTADALGSIPLIPRINIPSLDASHHTAAEVVFTLETRILEQVLHHLTIAHAPLRLRSEVGHADGVDADTVAIDDDTLIGCHGIAVGVILTVGVVEGTAIRRIAHAFCRYVSVSAIVETESSGTDISLEAHTLVGGGKRIEVLGSVIDFHAGLHGIAVLTRSEALEGHGFIGTSIINLSRGDIFLFQIGTTTGKIDVSTEIA